MSVAESTELVFAFAAPLGVDLDLAERRLTYVLNECAYDVHSIRLSRFLKEEYRGWQGHPGPKLGRLIEDHQQAGNDFREQMQQKDALGQVALAEISAARSSSRSARQAFVVRQLKTPEEVLLLRKAYGDRFIVLGVTAPEDVRRKWLAERIAVSEEGDPMNFTRYEPDARNLIRIDDKEAGTEYGQNLSGTFPLADYFAVLNSATGEGGQRQFDDACRRLMALLLAQPKIHPTDEECFMFQAHAASYQSADRGRQVGAVIASLQGSVIAVGRNDYPKIGGGVMPTASYEREEQVSQKIKGDTVEDILRRLKPVLQDAFVDKNQLEQKAAAMALLSGSRLFGMNEFNWMVHAEMAALSDAASRGTSVGGQVMFCTTFPCQNCAKHLIAAGIRALYYIAPYPKSLVKVMYAEEYDELPMLPLASADLRKLLANEDRRRFLIFTYLGVAPRRYVEFFTMPLRKLADGKTPEWNIRTALPRIENLSALNYQDWEASAVEILKPFRKSH